MATAIELRRKGAAFKEIGAAMGISPRWAQELVAAGMERVVVDAVNDLRALESRSRSG
jgi:hypothetical protein